MQVNVSILAMKKRVLKRRVLSQLIISIIFLSNPPCFAENISFGVGFLNPSLDLSLSHPNQDKAITFNPNSSGTTQYLLNLQDLGISISQANAPTEDQELIDVETEVTDMQFSFFKEEHNFFFGVQSYTGYFVSNAEELNPSYTKYSSESGFADLKSSNYSARYIYAFNGKDFNLDSVYGIGKQQKKSAGSLLVSVGAFSESYESPSQGLAPSYAASDYADLQNFRSLKLTGIELQLGYSYTIKFTESLFFNFISMLGRSQLNQTLNYANSAESKSSGANNSFTAGMSFGMNAKKFKINIQALTFTTEKDINQYKLSSDINNVGFYMVYRL